MKYFLFFLSGLIPLKIRMQCYYYVKFGCFVNFKKPTKLSEKIQVRKFNLIPEYSLLSDKVYVKKYVSEIIGPSYVIPTLKVFNFPDDICFEGLPNTFVMKTNFGSGSSHLELVENASKLDVEAVKDKFRKAYSSKYKGAILGETQYDEIDRKILVEEMLEEPDLIDYKFHVFRSVDGFIQVDIDRFSSHKRNLYDFNFELLPHTLQHSRGEIELPSEENLKEMKEVAISLSRGFDYVRIDLYSVKGAIYFGEMTFTPGSGFEKFSDEAADELYGGMW